MIVQACINGARPRDFHPRLPLTAEAMAADAAACVAAGAAELHIHPRCADGRESLAAVDETVLAVRKSWRSLAGASCRTMLRSTSRSRTRRR